MWCCCLYSGEAVAAVLFLAHTPSCTFLSVFTYSVGCAAREQQPNQAAVGFIHCCYLASNLASVEPCVIVAGRGLFTGSRSRNSSTPGRSNASSSPGGALRCRIFILCAASVFPAPPSVFSPSEYFLSCHSSSSSSASSPCLCVLTQSEERRKMEICCVVCWATLLSLHYHQHTHWSSCDCCHKSSLEHQMWRNCC